MLQSLPLSRTDSGVLAAYPALLSSFILTAGDAADASAILYDNASAASGTVLARLKAVQKTSASAPFPQPVKAASGIYLALTGTDATVDITVA